MKEAVGGRPRPFGLPNFATDEKDEGGGQGQQEKPFTLLPGKTPLGERIVKQGGQAESAQSTLGEEINAFLEERARLREQGQLNQPEGYSPIITLADAISVDLGAFNNRFGEPQTEEARRRWLSVDRIEWGFDALAFGLFHQERQRAITIGYEFRQGFNRNRPHVLDKLGRLNSEEAAILTEQLVKVGLPFQTRPEGITIPFAPTVQTMRKMIGGEPLFPNIPPPNLTHIKDHPRRNH